MTQHEAMLFHILGEHDPRVRHALAAGLYEELRRSQQAPIVADSRVVFLYYGNATSVAVVGDWTYWQPATQLQRIEHTDLFYCILEFPVDARLQYKFVVDGEWLNDPANSRVLMEGFGANTEFVMPKYADTSSSERDASAPEGIITPFEIHSRILGETRTAYLYEPHACYTEDATSLLLVHDGVEAMQLGRFHVILDNLHADASIRRTAAVFLPPRDRNNEYATSERFREFCAREVIDEARRLLSMRGSVVHEDRAHVGVTGASLGGLLATHLGIGFPDVFGTVLAQSPSYWWNKGEIFRSSMLANAKDLVVVVQTGTICDAKDLASLMVSRLRALTCNVSYFEYSQGHTWGNWRSTFADALRSWHRTLRAGSAVINKTPFVV